MKEKQGKCSSTLRKRRKKTKKTKLWARYELLKAQVRAWVLKASKVSQWAYKCVSIDSAKKWLIRAVIIGLLASGSSVAVDSYAQVQVLGAKDSVLMLTPINNPNRGGTGFAIETPAGPRVITNAHVCRVSDNGKLLAHRDGKPLQTLSILRIDSKSDLCLLEMAFGVPTLSLGSQPEVNSVAYSWGHPGLRPVTLESGRLLEKGVIALMIGFPDENDNCPEGSYKSSISFWGIELPICLHYEMAQASTIRTFGGSSGSPVLNKWGNVIGVIFAGDTSTNNGYLVPFEELDRFVNEIK